MWQGLLDRGVLVRETGPPGWLRVSIGTPAEMGAFRAALTEVLDSTQGRRPPGGSRGVAPPGQHGGAAR